MPVTIETRDYQVAAVNAVIKKFETADRTQLHMAPGTGKTIVSLLIKEKLDPTLTVVFVPTIQLIHQQFLAWSRGRSTKYRSLAIVSGILTREDSDDVSDLCAHHVDTTTDPSKITKFIRSSGKKVVFCTYRSSPILAQVMAQTDMSIDLAVFDEAHRVAGSYEKKATALLDDQKIGIRKRLFMTATPRILKNDQDAIIFAGMDDASQFGEVAYSLTFREAVDRNILVDYQLVVAAVTQDDLNTINATESKKERIALAAIGKTIREYDVKRGLTFHGTVAKAKGFFIALSRYLPKKIYTATLNASHGEKHRSAVLKKVKSSDRSVITNVRILGEGFDFDALDYIMFVDPKNSPVDIVQNMGRVMRKHSEKTIGTIVLPILLVKDDKKSGWQIESSRFSAIFRVASALGSIDAMFGALLGTSSGHTVMGRDELNQFADRHIKVIGIDSSDKELLASVEEKIKLYVVAGSGREFRREEMLEELKTFCEKHNRLPSRLKVDELHLFNFVNNYHCKDVTAEVKALIKPFIDKYRTQKIDRRLPIEEQYDIFEAWVRVNRRFPYNGHGGSKESQKQLFEDNGMTLTDEELYMRQWIYNRAPKKLTPALKQRLADLRKWVITVSPTSSQLVKEHGYPGRASDIKARLLKLGVKPFFCAPTTNAKILWNIDEVRQAFEADAEAA